MQGLRQGLKSGLKQGLKQGLTADILDGRSSSGGGQPAPTLVSLTNSPSPAVMYLV